MWSSMLELNILSISFAVFLKIFSNWNTHILPLYKIDDKISYCTVVPCRIHQLWIRTEGRKVICTRDMCKQIEKWWYANNALHWHADWWQQIRLKVRDFFNTSSCFIQFQFHCFWFAEYIAFISANFGSNKEKNYLKQEQHKNVHWSIELTANSINIQAIYSKTYMRYVVKQILSFEVFFQMSLSFNRKLSKII